MKLSKRNSVVWALLTGTFVAGGFALAGYQAERYFPQTLLVPLLKFSIGIIGIPWLFSVNIYNKLSDLTDISGLDHRQHRNLEVEVRARIHWFWFRAFILGVLALMLYIPTLLTEAKICIPAWVIPTCFSAFGLALYSLLGLWRELEEIRELKSYVKQVERREKERQEQVKQLKDAHKGEWIPDDHFANMRQSNSDGSND